MTTDCYEQPVISQLQSAHVADYFRWPGWPTGWLKYAQIVHYGAAHHRPRDRQIMESGTLVTTHSVPVWVWCDIWVNASLAAAEPLHENEVTTDRTVLVLVTEQGRHSFRAACSAPRRRACRPALSAGRPARSAGSPGRARPAGLAGRSASARRPGRSRGGASDEPLGNLTAILRICRAGVRRLLPWRLRCRCIAPGRSGVPGLRRSCRPPALGEAGAAAEHALIAARPRTALTRRRRRTRTGDYSCLSVSARSGLTMDAR